MAGAAPNTRPVITEISRAKPNTGQLTVTSLSRGIVRGTNRGVDCKANAVADHSRWCETWRVVLRPEQPTDLGSHTQHGKVVGASSDQLEAFRLRPTGEIYAASLRTGHVLEYSGPISEVLQFG